MKKQIVCGLLCTRLCLSFAQAAQSGFTDVREDDWFAPYVSVCAEAGLMNGTAADTFTPNASTTRGQIVAILYRLEGSPAAGLSQFSDVGSGAYYASAVSWASANGIVNGYGDGTFRPGNPITREQMAVMMYRYANMLGLDTSAEGDMNGFPDAGRVSPFAEREVNWAVGAGLIKGDGGNVNPQGTAERA